jgi:GNAT superfamily N-acetyltransferase
MQIREATHDDEPAITERLLHPAYRDSADHAPAFNELDEDAIADADASRWLDHDERVIFVAEDEGTLAGYVSGMLTGAPAIYARDQQAGVDGLYVHPDCRRQGVASRLFDRIEAWADDHGCEYVGVTVHVNNDAAKEFYDERFELTFYSYREKLE